MLDEDSAVIAAGRLDPNGDSFIDEELLDLELKGALGAELGDAFLQIVTRAGNWLGRELGELGVGIAVSLRIEAFGAFGDGLSQNKFAFELAFVFGEVFFFGDGSENSVSGDGTVGAGSPSFGVGDERERMRRDDLHGGAFIGPAATEGPRLEVDVRELPRLHLFGGPFGGVSHVGRVGEARAVDIGEVADNFHDLGGLRVEAFFPDLMDCSQVGLANGRGLGSKRNDRQEQS